ncbi:hypothetical protein FM120_08975 [Sphingobacterium faecium PCAi_F2.5]|nr:hypothetical protein BN1088_1430327 [Sphingobacterium sp. PM2-P1-29]SJN33977.1 hypothetical protein FM120_08975 [Sphingobacterium faecium PCAi_F2.5]
MRDTNSSISLLKKGLSYDRKTSLVDHDKEDDEKSYPVDRR